MKLRCQECCAVVLTTQNTEISINNEKITDVKENSLILLSCENNSLEINHFDNQCVAYISRETINNYLTFLKRDITKVCHEARRSPDYFVEPCRAPKIFAEAASLSQQEDLDDISQVRKNSLLFTVLSVFLAHRRFLPFLIKVSQNDVRTQVYTIIQSNISKGWALGSIASSLCMSASVLKKRLREENTSYTKIITDCRMRFAAEQLTIYHQSIAQVSAQCGYSSASYFISVFKKYYGTTPLNYIRKYSSKMQS